MSHDTLTAAIAAASAILGATAKGIWEWLSQRDQDSASVTAARIDDGAAIRGELWEEIDKLRTRLDAMQEDLDQSRRGFLTLLEEHTTLKAEYRTLKFDHDALLIRYAELELRVNNI